MTKMSENSKTDVPDVGRLEWDHVDNKIGGDGRAVTVKRNLELLQQATKNMVVVD
jgi:hypothetical protein